MARELESECRGCAECIGCGLKHQKYYVYYCDECGGALDTIVYLDGERELCEFCAAHAILDSYDFPDEIAETMTETGFNPDCVEDVYAYFEIPVEKQFDFYDVRDVER